ncbi:hypothetical protein NVP1115B_24 [Vibrio phage 1.115.B._10N.222.49.B11]|nr:hypothetical protein NVP1115A_24 [Vibrio phage 1.115.A._10N.222.49.B11]AUR88570.1 hypothetical protein NVP1115B_24 [Vibrio phage 1.115.B._10N.222.49.B11]
MGFKATITKNGMTGELYFVIVSSNERKMQGIADVRVRSFESREKLHQAIECKNVIALDGGEQESVTHFVTDEVFEVPLDENKNLTTGDAYLHIISEHYPGAVAC